MSPYLPNFNLNTTLNLLQQQQQQHPRMNPFWPRYATSTSVRNDLDNLNDPMTISATPTTTTDGGGQATESSLHPFLRRMVRQVEASLVNGTASPLESPSNATTPEPAPTPAPGPGIGEKVMNTAKEVAAKGAEIAGKGAEVVGKGVEFTAQKSHIPVWAVYILAVVIVTTTTCCCYVGWLLSKRYWRRFKKSEKGKEVFQKMSENEYLCKFVPDPEPEPDQVDLTEYEEPEEEPEETEPLGKIHYKLEYDFEANTLTVHIIECKDLKAMDAAGTSDAYVKIFFPGDKKKFETKVHRKTLNPTYNEAFVYKNLPFFDLMAKTLMIQVFDYDRFGTHDQIGEVRIVMVHIDLSAGPVEDTKDLMPVVDNDALPGDICFSLRYAPSTTKLTVCIIECKNLKQMDLGGLADPFVKIQLLKDGIKLRKKKSSVKKCTLNPYFNESFVFEVPEKELLKHHIIVTVYDYDLIGGCDPIGRIAVGPKQKGKGRQHWMEMVENPRRPIIQWHSLIDPDEFKAQQEELTQPKPK